MTERKRPKMMLGLLGALLGGAMGAKYSEDMNRRYATPYHRQFSGSRSKVTGIAKARRQAKKNRNIKRHRAKLF